MAKICFTLSEGEPVFLEGFSLSRLLSRIDQNPECTPYHKTAVHHVEGEPRLIVKVPERGLRLMFRVLGGGGPC